MIKTADAVWVNNMCEVLDSGMIASPRPGSDFTGKTMELINFESSIDMRFPVVTIPQRRLGYRFLAAEARWIINGDDRLATIAPYSPVIHKFSDDGVTFFGAYGPRVKAQLQGVVDALAADNDTRQAVLTIWRSNPPKTKDMPCTVAIQWLIRNGRIHCIDTMRSSDLWLGWPYDVFNFSMLTAIIVLMLRTQYKLGVVLGDLSLRAGSQHLYERDWENSAKCVSRPDAIEYAPLDLRYFRDADDLISFLSKVADGKDRNNLPWLKEIFVPR